ncbi:MAG: integrase core domain-containing protein [Thermodesulfobacteriota bacterium]
MQNDFIESFNGILSNECFNQHWFVSIEETRRIIKPWHMDSTLQPPQSSLGHVKPHAFRLSLE